MTDDLNKSAANDLEPASDLLSPGQEHIEQVWAERAAQLAQIETKPEKGEQLVVVLIRLGRELFGLDVQYVHDIRARELLTRVPRVPEWVAGVTNLRGRILSVINLRAYLGLPPSPQPEQGLLVVVQAASMELIFLVDDVPAVEILPVRQNLAGNILLHHLPATYIQAVLERQGSASEQRPITVLDVDALLSDPRLTIREELA